MIVQFKSQIQITLSYETYHYEVFTAIFVLSDSFACSKEGSTCIVLSCLFTLVSLILSSGLVIAFANHLTGLIECHSTALVTVLPSK